MYVLVTGETATYYTPTDLRRDNPDTSFPAAMSDQLLAEFGVWPCLPVDAPTITQAQNLTMGPPEYADGQWRQTWIVTDATPEEIAARYAATIPQVISMRQARLALLGAGVLPTVDAAVAQLGGAAQIEWEYATEVRRDNQLVAHLGAVLGLGEVQIDDLFKQAAAL